MTLLVMAALVMIAFIFVVWPLFTTVVTDKKGINKASDPIRDDRSDELGSLPQPANGGVTQQRGPVLGPEKAGVVEAALAEIESAVSVLRQRRGHPGPAGDPENKTTP